jgi:CheY-like chemotaxis protein
VLKFIMTKDFSLTRKSALRVKLPKAARVLVLDDDPKRLQWFRESVRDATGDAPKCCTTVDELIDELEGGEFDVVFLDHDLCWLDAAYSERKHGNGKEAARYLAWMGFKGMIVIHSVNEDGAKAMNSYLPQARVAPFGTFELESTVSPSSVSIKKSDPR